MPTVLARAICMDCGREQGSVPIRDDFNGPGWDFLRELATFHDGRCEGRKEAYPRPPARAASASPEHLLCSNPSCQMCGLMAPVPTRLAKVGKRRDAQRGKPAKRK